MDKNHKQRLDEINVNYALPLDIETQFALLWRYRMALTEIFMLENELRKSRKMQGEQNIMIQEWILKNPSKKTAL